MKNQKVRDQISQNIIIPPDDVKQVSPKIGDADHHAFCVYDHQRHAVGSILKKQDGPDAVCTENGDWKNVTEKDKQ